MITAIMARKNTDTTKTSLAQKAKERARIFCDKQISPLITTASRNGDDYVIVDIGEDIDVNEVTINLLENQFKVGPGTNPNSITVMW